MTSRGYLSRRGVHILRDRVFLRFLVAGVINTTFAYLVLVLLLYFGLTLELATLGSLIGGILLSYQTQGRFVFGHRSRSVFVRFLLFWMIIYVVNLSMIRLFMGLGLNFYLSGALASVPNTMLSFFIGKLIIFRDGGVGSRS